MLIDSRWPIAALEWKNVCKFSFKAQGFGAGDMTWRVPPGTTYRITSRAGTAPQAVFSIKSTDAGHLKVALPSSQIAAEVEASCVGEKQAMAVQHVR